MKGILLALLIVVLSLPANAQGKRRPSGFNSKPKTRQEEKFLQTQWWLGFKAGINLSQAVPTERYTVMTPVNYALSATDKAYDSFNKVGSQASIEVTLYYKGFSFSAQPTYMHSVFTYSNQYTWNNPENAAEQLILNYNQEQKIDYACFPLFVKYDITGNKLRPFVQAGIFYSILVNANKSVEVSETDYASGGTNQINNEPVIVGAKDLFTNYWGLMAGAGVSYNLGNVRLVLDASYWKGMSNIANTENRFSNDRLSGIGDAQDNINLNNIVISFGCLFPMRFLSNDFKSLDR